ncbi:Serine/threonine-protein kinase dst2 [Dictyostelium discoideum] [Rhizoctonia solani]|uniref:Serine/threonine-protein kinase dst2 [Dictyostelium discoideum] n=1 Tax=Rhizoctonia solani TaxID=456999 RepID=A0A0K6GEW5_9AGAM|nr:Serine/threonine-protein kinase dst2 [Dictyostelium discoideum] [Rhizoctonia solani]
MSCQEIVLLLTDHGCHDFTKFLDEPTFSKYPVASGGLGDVFFGCLIDKSPLAIKTIRSCHEPGQSARVYHKRAAREIYTWSKCKHPNVVPLIGLAVFRDCLAMISRWEENGSLLHYLSLNPSVDRCTMSTSICAGLAYLHEHDIVHGDLKGANVLISQDGTPMLMDFGNASLLEATLQFTQTTTGPYISPQWTAPEILAGTSSYTIVGDIYSLGMTILEAFTSQIPFPDRNNHALLMHVVIHKKIPVRPETAMPTNSIDGDKLWAILTRCWSYDPKDRPTAETVWNEMKEITAENLKEIQGRGDKEEGRQNKE